MTHDGLHGRGEEKISTGVYSERRGTANKKRGTMQGTSARAQLPAPRTSITSILLYLELYISRRDLRFATVHPVQGRGAATLGMRLAALANRSLSLCSFTRAGDISANHPRTIGEPSAGFVPSTWTGMQIDAACLQLSLINILADTIAFIVVIDASREPMEFQVAVVWNDNPFHVVGCSYSIFYIEVETWVIDFVAN